MRNVIYDSVNYDYPTCGGLVVTRGIKYDTLEICSNYQGNITGFIAKLLIANRDYSDPGYQDPAYLREIASVIVSRGYKVL